MSLPNAPAQVVATYENWMKLSQHVADLRDPEKGFEESGIYELEFRGWSATSLSIVAFGQKVLTLPGGYVLWNAAWPAADRSANITESIKGYLGTEELLTR